jgi:hypothetical protein
MESSTALRAPIVANPPTALRLPPPPLLPGLPAHARISNHRRRRRRQSERRTRPSRAGLVRPHSKQPEQTPSASTSQRLSHPAGRAAKPPTAPPAKLYTALAQRRHRARPPHHARTHPRSVTAKTCARGRREGGLATQPARTVGGERMGSHKCRIVGKSQSVLGMINPIIFTRTRTMGGEERVPAPAPPPLGAPGILRAERLLPAPDTQPPHPTQQCVTQITQHRLAHGGYGCRGERTRAPECKRIE